MVVVLMGKREALGLQGSGASWLARALFLMGYPS